MLDDCGDPAFKDEYGLREVYDEEDAIAVHGDTMYIAGTRLDRLSGARDVLGDVTFCLCAKHLTHSVTSRRSQR